MGKVTDELNEMCSNIDSVTLAKGMESLLDCLMENTEKFIAETLEKLPSEDHEEARLAILELKRENLH